MESEMLNKKTNPDIEIIEQFDSGMAERVGFEPTSPFGRTAFRERRLKPLGNLSMLSRSYEF